MQQTEKARQRHSRETVECRECKKLIHKETLRSHFNSFHKGIPIGYKVLGQKKQDSCTKYFTKVIPSDRPVEKRKSPHAASVSEGDAHVTGAGKDKPSVGAVESETRNTYTPKDIADKFTFREQEGVAKKDELSSTRQLNTRTSRTWNTPKLKGHVSIFENPKLIGQQNSEKENGSAVHTPISHPPLETKKLSPMEVESLDSSFGDKDVESSTVVQQKPITLPNIHDILSTNTALDIFHQMENRKSVDDIRNIIKPYKDSLLKIEELCKATSTLTMMNLSAKGVTPRYSEASIKRLSTEIASDFTVLQARGDGNCFYHSVSTGIFGDESYSPVLRLLCLNHLINYEKDLKPTIRTVFNRTYEQIIESTRMWKMRGNEGWASEANIYAMSAILGRPIIVYQPASYKEKFDFHAETSGETPLVLTLMGEHFMPMLCLKSNPKSTSAIINNGCPLYDKGYKYNGIGMVDNSPPCNVPNPDDVSIVHDGTKPEIQRPAQKQTDLSSFFTVKSSKTETSRLKTADAVIVSKDSRMGQSVLADFRQRTPDHASSSEKLSSSSAEEPDQHTAKSFDSEGTKLGVDSLRKEIHEIKENVDKLAEMMSAVLRCQQGGFVSSKIKEKYVNTRPDEATEIFSLPELIKAFPFITYRLIHENLETKCKIFEFQCNICVVSNREKLYVDPTKDPNQVTGVFRFETKDEVFRKKHLPREFVNLKMKINRHLNHRRAGLILGRLAYAAIKMDHNISRYEDYVALVSSAFKGSVGELNHSTDFCRKFGKFVYSILINDFREYLCAPLPSTGRPPAISIIADKYTPKRRAGQIVGLVAFKDDRVKDFNVDFARVLAYDGISIAKLLYDSLRLVVDQQQIKTRLVGGCFDGEYFNKSVPEHFMRKNMKIALETEEWYTWDWDQAHIIERGVADALKTCSIFTDVSGTVHHLNKQFRIGKAYTEAEFYSETERFYAPLQRSDTRFARYQYRVLENFRHNFGIIYDILEARKDDKKQRELKFDFYRIENMEFVIAFASSIDIFNRIAEISEKCQTVGVNTWRLNEAVEAALGEIQQMCDSIDSGNVHPKMSTLQKAIESLGEELPQFEGRKISLIRTCVPATRSTAMMGQQSLDEYLTTLAVGFRIFSSTVAEKFSGRAERQISALEPHMEAAFRLDNVLANAKQNNVPDGLVVYFEAARAAEYLPADVNIDTIREEYLSFCKSVEEMYQGLLEFNPRIDESVEKLEQLIYNRIIGASRPSNHANVTDLLVSVLSRSHCESVCESMGSVIKNVVDDRSIDFRNIQEEMFISYNGPPPYAEGIEDLLEDALDMCWPEKPWHIYRETKRQSLLKYYHESKVIDRKKHDAKTHMRLAHRRIRSKSI